MGIDIAQIVEVGAHIAQAGTIRSADIGGDEIFEYLIAVGRMMEEPAGFDR